MVFRRRAPLTFCVFPFLPGIGTLGHHVKFILVIVNLFFSSASIASQNHCPDSQFFKVMSSGAERFDYFTLINAYYGPLSVSRQYGDEHKQILGDVRRCLVQLEQRVRMSPNHPVVSRRDHRYFGVSTIGTSFYLKHLRAFTYLYHPDLENQDPLRARALIAEAISQLQSDLLTADRAIRAHYQERERQARASRRMQFIGAAIGTALVGRAAKMDTLAQLEMLSTEVRRIEQRIDSQTQLARSANDPIGDSWFKTSGDGVRLHVLRIVPRLYRPSSLTNHSGDHTQHIVRVTAVDPTNTRKGCTGVFIGNGLILTAQHCIRDQDGSYYTNIQAHFEYTTIDQDSVDIHETTYYPVEIQTAPSASFAYITGRTASGKWGDNWGNDWAVLKVAMQDQNSLGWAHYAGHVQDFEQVKRRYDELGIPLRIAIGGYSGDLDSGAFITMDWGCEISRVNEGVLEHKCRGWKGSSGAPIVVANGPAKGSIVGVHAFGQGDGSTNRGGGGPFLSQDILRAIEELRR